MKPSPDAVPPFEPQALMHASAGECAERARSGAEQRPRKVLEAAWRATRRAGVLGSATICLVALHPSKPELIVSDATTLDVQWSPPVSLGGGIISKSSRARNPSFFHDFSR